MRWSLLVLLAGCRQLFGLEPPSHAQADAPAIGSDAPIDAPLLTACATANSNLVACFDFEGDAVNNSGTMLSVTSNVAGYVPGVLGQAVQLDVVSTIHIAETTSLDVMEATLEAWIKLDQLPAQGARMGVIDNDGQYGLFVLSDGSFTCNTNSQTLTVAAAIPAGQWTHVACVDGLVNVIAYRDGSQIGQMAEMLPLGNAGTNGTSIGGNSPSGEPLIGDLDAVRIYSVARGAAQICRDAGRTTCP